MPDTLPLAAADRLRSCFVAGLGFGFGFMFWAGWPDAGGKVGAEAKGLAPAVFWIGLALSAAAYGLWRYLIEPARALVRAQGMAATFDMMLRVLVVCLPWGLLCGMMLLPLGANVPIIVDALILLALIWGWDWMKDRSQPALAAAVPGVRRAVP